MSSSDFFRKDLFEIAFTPFKLRMGKGMWDIVNARIIGVDLKIPPPTILKNETGKWMGFGPSEEIDPRICTIHLLEREDLKGLKYFEELKNSEKDFGTVVNYYNSTRKKIFMISLENCRVHTIELNNGADPEPMDVKINIRYDRYDKTWY